MSSFDHLLKLLLVGDSGVGKTCLLLRFVEKTFQSSFISTIGIDFKMKTVDIDGQVVKLQIWDTAGQDRFRAITTAYYRGAMGIVLVYDITEEQSFLNVRNWVTSIHEHGADNIVVVLVGNKCDMVDRRSISKERGREMADEYSMRFYEASAKNDINVKELFINLGKDIILKTKKKAEIEEEKRIQLEPATSRKKCNCT